MIPILSRIPWMAGLVAAAVLLHGGCGNAKSEDITGLTSPVIDTVATEHRTTAASPRTSEIQVEIQGAVHRPGAYAFAPETRLYEALRRAGGITASAEIRDLNIAAPLRDGSVLTVPSQEGHSTPSVATAAQLNPAEYTRSGWFQVSASSVATADNGGNNSGCTDLNRATSAELEALPGVGPKTAEKIIRYREAQPFTQVEDLRNVQGIGDTRMQSLRPLVCVQQIIQ